jgi:hypothetical protein
MNLGAVVNLSEQLKLLAKGTHPETGEVFGDGSIVNRPETIRLLYDLSEELLLHEKPKKTKQKQKTVGLREKNLADGLPPRAFFPWSNGAKESLENAFKKNPNMEELANQFERSVLSIAIQLQKLALISKEDLELLRGNLRGKS